MRHRHRGVRVVAGVLVPALVVVGIPVPASAEPAGSRPTEPTVQVNMTTPPGSAPPAFPAFSPAPTDAEIMRAHVFGEPLQPLGSGSLFENAALAEAVTSWLKTRNPEATRPLEAFLAARPNSVWRASLLANLGTTYERLGYFTRAEQKLNEAWLIAKDSTEPRASAVAEQALSELLDMHMQFGQIEPLERLVRQAQGRELMGVATERVEQARSAIWGLKNAHEYALPSGPIAIGQILRYIRPEEPRAPEIMSFHATPNGASIAQIADLTRAVDFPMEPAFRPAGVEEIPIPSIAHLRPGHFAAIVGEANGRYILDDPLLGGEVWITQTALREQSSGYFLVPEGEAPAGWTAPPAGTPLDGIRGKCGAPDGGPNEACNGGGSGCCNGGTGGGCNAQGMAGYSFNPLLASIMLRDTPVGYAPPKGPDVRFQVQYHQRGSTQPTTPTFTNMGSLWFPTWFAYIEDDPTNPLGPASLIGYGGGIIKYSGFSGDGYAPDPTFRSELVRVSSDPIQYERRNTDGSREVYALANGTTTVPRRIFLTEWFDPQGQRLLFTYDSRPRLLSITDALGQVTTLSYENLADDLKVTKVTDPFGRFARFDYDATQRLIRITDVIGIQSEFHYGGGAFVSELQTPYGMTTFQAGLVTDQGGHPLLRWAEAKDPLGATERIELGPYGDPSLPGSDPANVVPAGFLPENVNQNAWLSFHWNKRAMALHPGDRSKAHVMKWAFSETFKYLQVLTSEKRPLENRVWYAYEGSPAIGWVANSRWPSKVARVLDDGTTQSHRFEWTNKGKLQRYTDPLGRETAFAYGGSGIDLLTVKQRNGFALDLLAELSNSGLHLPLTVKDASGQTTTLTYNAAGQPLTVTNAKNETTTLTYSTPGYLETITGPAVGSTVTLTWDLFGRIRTVTYDGRTVTFSYDGFDRVTRVDYPDGTFEQLTYKWLDPETHRDRQGRVSRLFYDALQRLVSFQNPLGRIVKQTWCECGDLAMLTDAAGNETKWARDLQGRVTAELRANGSSTTVIYENTTNRVKKVTDAKLQDALYEYFLDDSLKRISFANAMDAPAPVSFTYDSFYRRVSTKTDGQGQTTYGYNGIATQPTLGAGRLASIDGPTANDTVTVAYDQLGRLVSRAINGASESVIFDTLGRLQSVTNPLGTFNYTYLGTTARLQTVSYPNGQTTELSYLTAGQDHQLQEILHKRAGGALLARHAYSYEVTGNINTWTQETAESAATMYEFEYDSVGQLRAATRRTTAAAPSVLQRFVFSYDAAGNRSSEQIDNGITSAIHNGMNQTTSVQPGGTLRLAGTTNEPAMVSIAGQPAESLPGNRFQGETPVGSGTTSVPVVAKDGSGNQRTYTYDVSVSGTTRSLTYDANGNALSDGIRTYEWDGNNRVTAINHGTHRSEFGYDALGRRIRIVEKENGVVVPGGDRRFLWVGRSIAEERDGTGATTKRQFFGQGFKDGAAVFFYKRDHLGSIREVVDTAGAVRARYDYDPYGRRTKVSGDVDADFGYTDYFEHADSGLKLTLHRAYDPALGRWLSRDPMGLRGGLNVYAYVDGNPINRIDPLGLSWATFTEGLVTGLFWGAVIGVGVGVLAASAPVWGTIALIAGVGLIWGHVISQLGKAYYGVYCADDMDYDIGNVLGGIAGGGLGGRFGANIGRFMPGSRPITMPEYGLPDDAILVRAGENLPKSFDNASGASSEIHTRTLEDVSMTGASGKSIAELSEGFRNNQIGVTTAGELRAAGGEFFPDEVVNPLNPYHGLAGGLTPEEFASLMKVQRRPGACPPKR